MVFLRFVTARHAHVLDSEVSFEFVPVIIYQADWHSTADTPGLSLPPFGHSFHNIQASFRLLIALRQDQQPLQKQRLQNCSCVQAPRDIQIMKA